jgi:hypothetical protein
MAVIGVLLWISSIVIISFAPKYQTELIPGRGHIPVVVQDFGWALVVAAVLFALLRSAVARSRAAVWLVAFGAAGLLGLGAGVVGFNNMRVIGVETPVRETRALLQRGAEAGVLAKIPTDSSLVFTTRDLGWPTGRWSQFPDALESALEIGTGRSFDGRLVPPPESFNCPPSGGSLPADCEPLRDSAAWVMVRPRPDGGSVIVGSLPQIPAGRAAFTATTRELRAFVREDDAPVRSPTVIGLTASGREWSSAAASWQRVDQGDGWAIYEARLTREPFPVASTLNDPRARVDFAALPGPDQIVRIYGTRHLLP